MATLADILGKDYFEDDASGEARAQQAPAQDAIRTLSRRTYEQPVAANSSSLPDDLAALRAEQAASLQEHAQFAQGLQQKQQQVDLRAQDLDISERLMAVLDTQTPKFVRNAMFRELSTRLGVDPNGNSSKELARTLISLDPDSATSIKSVFVGQMAQASPGTVSQFASSILRGEVGVYELGKLVKTAQAQKATQSDAYSTGGEFGARDIPPQDPAALSQGIPQPKPVAPDNRVVEPGMAQALGYDPNTSSSAEILQRHPGISISDATERRKLTEELATARVEVQNTKRIAGEIQEIIDKNPNAVAYSGGLVALADRFFNIFREKESRSEINLPALQTGMRDFLKDQGIVNVEGLYKWFQQYDPTGFTTAQLEKLKNDKEGAKAFTEVTNKLVALAYSSAKARDPSGRIAVDDVQNEFRALASNSGSADMLRTGLNSHASTVEGRYQGMVRAKTGGEAVPVDSSPVTLNLNSGAKSGNASGTKQSSIDASTPVGQAQQARSREQAKEADETVQQETRRLTLENLPEMQRMHREAAQRDATRLQLAIDEAKERKDERAYRHARDAKKDAEAKAEKIQSLFAQIGKLIGSGPSGGGGSLISGGGGDQDVSAFRITPAPQRSAPTPVQAQGGLEGVRRRLRNRRSD